ncbi:thiamine-monophosphate kinase [alpha proteobacterium AAP81b]|nr:thiamine-monophosphate kinase [alpha proteobacterium AAP81b]
MNERRFIADLLTPLATTAAARGFADDAAVWAPPLGRELVMTHDTLVAGTHFLPGDPPADIAWKLLAVNLCDLAAMGARPAGVLLSLALSPAEDDAWRSAFTTGLARALATFDVALWGGDTVAGVAAAVLGITAIGHVAAGKALPRHGARPGDGVFVSGTIGDAGLGLAIARGAASADKFLLARYRRPQPRLALGAALAGVATAAMDISDGLLIDADRLAAASGVGLALDLAALPLSPALVARAGDDDAARLAAATAGDDYELLFTMPPGTDPAPLAGKIAVTRIGVVTTGAGLALTGRAGPLALPARLGWEH